MLNKILGVVIAFGGFVVALNIAKLGGDLMGKLVEGTMQAALTGKAFEATNLLKGAGVVGLVAIVAGIFIALVSFAIALHFFAKGD